MSEPESPESSSPLITRLVAAALRGQPFSGYTLPAWQRRALRLLGRLPPEAGRRLVLAFQALGGLLPASLYDLDVERLAQTRLRDYDGLPGPFPAITVGAGLGGAAAHLALCLAGPFLPQSYVFTLRGGSPRGELAVYLQHAFALARRITQKNPDLLALQHYDPVHDGWLTRRLNHLRLKLTGLPAAYQDFIRSRLAPGGVVCYLDCQATWLRFPLGERHWLQVGGWGDLPAEEYLSGSPRLAAYARQAGLAVSAWAPQGLKPEGGPESEWGVEAGLGEALQTFCERHGYRFVRLLLSQPHDYARLSYSAARRQFELQGRPPGGVLVQMFSQIDPAAALQAGLLPLWLVFNTLDSQRFLLSMRPEFPAGKPVYFAALPTFSLTPDLAPWSAWTQALHGLDWQPVGVRPSRYPADTRAAAEWPQALHRILPPTPEQPLPALAVDELVKLAAELTGP